MDRANFAVRGPSSFWPVIISHFPNEDYLFQDDNAPIHSSSANKQWKTENEIKCLTWQSQSQDIDIIEMFCEP